MTVRFDSDPSAAASASKEIGSQAGRPPPARHELPAGPPPPPPPGPIAQSVAIGFRSVYAAAALLLLLWLSGNIREIAPDSQAVVRRFGNIVRTQESGLLIAWPRPIEEVQILPGREQQLSQQVSALEPPTQDSRALVGPSAGGGTLPAQESAYLTGDGNVVLLNATLICHISDPVAYALSARHVAAALGRLFRAATVQVAAGRYLNDFLVVNNAALQTVAGQGGAAAQGTSAAPGGVVALRAEVRESLLRELNARLQALAAGGVALGVTVDRIDMTAWLPPEAKSAFDQVLLAAQTADREVADARTEAERRRQGATQLSEQLIASAQAQAQETLSDATVETAAIAALEKEETPLTRESLLMQRYRSGVSEIMKRVGAVRLVDPQTGARFVMPGGVPAAGAATAGGNP
jgi:regulator of protease activity HflC (stomatin/prohibitin superfamily)